MLTKKELNAIVKALPNKDYQKVADKLERVSAETVRKVLHEPKRYREDVIDAAFLVIEDHKAQVVQRKEKVKQL